MSVMCAANPVVIPRNHLVEEAISAAVNNSDFAPFENSARGARKTLRRAAVDLRPVRRAASARSGRATDILRYLEDRLAAGIRRAIASAGQIRNGAIDIVRVPQSV